MKAYEHSVLLDESKCTGCTTCIRHCPTEAIRIKNGKAVIQSDRCIDCGECIRHCSHLAKKAISDKLSDMDGFKWKIALPAPTLYGQFDNLDDIDYVLNGLLKIGFDEVYEVGAAAELISQSTVEFMAKYSGPLPLISSACPAILRLNLCRCYARSAELAAVEAFVDAQGQVTRPDILRAMNRMSSMLYILMLRHKAESSPKG